MAKTSIEWTDFSINPIRAQNKTTGAVGHYCEKISRGCQNCYASNLQKRFRMPAFNEQRGDENIEVFLDESKLQEVIKRKKPTKFFWCDMTDMFGEWVPDEFIDKCFAAMALSPQHTHQVLTKRPGRLLEYLGRDIEKRQDAIGDEAYKLTGDLFSGAPDCGEGFTYFQWPIPNVWLGVSCEDQRTADERIPLFLQAPAAVRFLSCEPLLGAIDLSEWLYENDELSKVYPDVGLKLVDKIHWVICGGESGHGARPMHPIWARSLRDQCAASGVAFHFKQNGEFLPVVKIEGQIFYVAAALDSPSPSQRAPSFVFPDGQRMIRVGKHAAGRLLDGRTHDEFPKVEK